jgi:hypothetical protein
MGHYNSCFEAEEALKKHQESKRLKEIGVILTYYELPAALHNIKVWEQLVFEQIIFKKVYQNNVILYLLDKKLNDNGYDYEVLICIPTGQIQDTLKIYQKVYHSELFKISEIDGNRKFSYNKCLVFGKVEKSELMLMVNAINSFQGEWIHEEI